MGTPIESDRLVFVAGLHRSGTTPLARTLALHPEVSGLTGTGVTEDEGQHLQSVYPPGVAYGGPGRFALDPRSHLTEESPLMTGANAHRLLEAWAPYWDLDRHLLVEKSPPNLVMTRFLQALFPQAAFVVVMRHPVVSALATVKWRRWISRRPQNHVSVEDMVAHWFAAHETFLADRPALRRVHVLRYEDLVADPAGELAPVADLLRLDTPVPADGIRASHSQDYLRAWEEMGDSRLRRRERARIVETYADPLRRFGYDAEDLTARLPFTV